MAGGERQGKHEGIRVATEFADMKQPGHGDRQHENIDRQQVERKYPGRLAQMGRVGVFNHRHLELARQAEDGQRREKSERPEIRRACGRPEIDEMRQRRRRRDAVEDVGKAVVEPVGDKSTNQQEGDQLDQRFERDRRHHAVVLLGRIDPTRAENHDEKAHDQRDVERGVGIQRYRSIAFGGAAQNVESRGDGLQLQRDVRNDADHRDCRHQASERLALAVTGGDEVGDRSDVLRLADRQQLAQEGLGKNEHQDRADIDRQETVAGRRGTADAAEKCPRGAIHRDRQRVDPGFRQLAQYAASPPCIDQIGDSEEQTQIKTCRQQYRSCAHRFPQARYRRFPAPPVCRAGQHNPQSGL